MHKNKKFNIQFGFGLIELMVSISIVVLVTSIILARHDSYNSAILLRSQAYDVALKMREVQLLSVSAVGLKGEYRNVMGLYFNTANSYYVVFRDNDGDNFYDEGEEVGPRVNLDRRFEFENINLIGSSGARQNQVSVIFERPNFDARFFTAPNVEPSSISGIELGIRFKGTEGVGAGNLRTLEVSRTGQIIVRPVSSNQKPDEDTKPGSDDILPGFEDPKPGDDEITPVFDDPIQGGDDEITPGFEDPKNSGGSETQPSFYENGGIDPVDAGSFY